MREETSEVHGERGHPSNVENKHVGASGNLDDGGDVSALRWALEIHSDVVGVEIEDESGEEVGEVKRLRIVDSLRLLAHAAVEDGEVSVVKFGPCDTVEDGDPEFVELCEGISDAQTKDEGGDSLF